MTAASLQDALAEAARLESRREYAAAMKTLDEALENSAGAPAPLRFRALVLRAEIAVTMDDPGLGRGILSEAIRIPLDAPERDALESELRRADDLEAFLTHRGCAG